MADFICRTCGGKIIVQPGGTFGVCDSCGNACKLELTQSERNQLLQKEATKKSQINDLQNQQKRIQQELDEFTELSKIRKKTFIATIISPVFWIALPFAETSETIVGIIGMIGFVCMFTAFPMLKKYAGVYANKKNGMVLGLLFQYLTLGMFGFIAGCQKLSKFRSMKKNREALKVELAKKLQELKAEENRLKTDSSY